MLGALCFRDFYCRTLYWPSWPRRSAGKVLEEMTVNYTSDIYYAFNRFIVLTIRLRLLRPNLMQYTSVSARMIDKYAQIYMICV